MVSLVCTKNSISKSCAFSDAREGAPQTIFLAGAGVFLKLRCASLAHLTLFAFFCNVSNARKCSWVNNTSVCGPVLLVFRINIIVPNHTECSEFATLIAERANCAVLSADRFNFVAPCDNQHAVTLNFSVQAAPCLAGFAVLKREETRVLSVSHLQEIILVVLRESKNLHQNSIFRMDK